MALISPEFLQTQKYSALRDRLAFQHGGAIQPGAWDANDFKVIQRAAGAAMFVDVNAGFALVGASSGGNFGYYHVQNDANITNVAISASHASLPRIDSVYLTVNDSTNGGDPNDIPAITPLAGTPTSGATLDNRSGAAAPPTDALLLADILVPAGSTSVVTANIRDRRSWARGANWTSRYIAGSISAPSNSSPATVATVRVECLVSPRVEMALRSQLTSAASGNVNMYPQIFMDGVLISDGAIDHNPPSTNGSGYRQTTMEAEPIAPFTPGSHVFDFKVSASVASLISAQATATSPILMKISEDPRQNSTN